MVTLRGKGIGDADQNSGRTQKHTTARSSETPPWSPPETRSRRSGPCNGLTSKDEEQSHVNSETHNEEERKCKMSFDNTDGRRSGPRRSTRSTKPTSRYQASNMFDGLSSNPTRSVRTTMDNMRRKRRLSNHNKGKVYAKTQRRRTPEPPERDLSESEKDQGPVPEEESRQEVATGDDSSCSMDRNFDAKLNRTSWLCQGPSSEFPRGTFRISASGPNTTRRGAFRATKSAWSSQSDDDNDSDDDLQNMDKVPERSI